MKMRGEVTRVTQVWDWSKQDQYVAKQKPATKNRGKLDTKVPKKLFKDHFEQEKKKYVKPLKFGKRMRSIFKED